MFEKFRIKYRYKISIELKSSEKNQNINEVYHNIAITCVAL